MTIIPIILIVLLIIGTFAFVFSPLLQERGVRRALSFKGQTSLTVDELIARRDAIYAALKDAEFDRETGKFGDEDYQMVRAHYMAEAAQILRQLDRLTPEAEAALDAEIEDAVAQLRSDGKELPPELVEAVEAEIDSLVRHATASGKHTLACPDCGHAYQPGDAFCAACGASLADTCPGCGAPHQPDDAFCARCGTPLAEGQEARNS